jgi:PAS domain S-box-containing protein
LIVSIKRSNRSEERFNALFESETIGVSITSADGSYIATNPAYQHMLRYSAE